MFLRSNLRVANIFVVILLRTDFKHLEIHPLLGTNQEYLDQDRGKTKNLLVKYRRSEFKARILIPTYRFLRGLKASQHS